MRLVLFVKAKRAAIGATSQDGKRKKVAEGKWVPIPKGGRDSTGSESRFKIGSIKYDTQPCSRCGGSGQHSYNSFTGETKCYKCDGSGTQLTKQAKKAREAVVAERKRVMEVSPKTVKVGDAIYSGGKWRRVTEVRIESSGDVDFRIGKGANWHGFGSRDKVMRYTPWPKESVDKVNKLSGVTVSWEPVASLSKAKRAPIGATSQDGKRKKVAEGRWVPLPKGKSPPKRIADKATVPPTWTDVEYFSGESDKLLLRGKDAKGRLQYVYNPKYLTEKSKSKFARINALNKVYDSIVAENDRNANSGNTEAECLSLILDTGIRPGSEKDTAADVDAFGATTLLGKHVVVSGDSVRLEFTGKKAVEQSIEVNSPQVRDMLIRRKLKVDDDSRIFATTGDRLLLYTKSLGSGAGFQSKDFRTHLGTATALDAMKGRRYPTTEAEYKKAVADVADVVSRKLGNTRKVALSSYINPAVFEKWRRRIEQS